MHSSNTTGLDHAGFACRELAPLLATFGAAGFAPTEPRMLHGVSEGGELRALGQWSAHVVFDSGYIELSSVPDPASRNHLEPFLARYEGLHIVALQPDDIDAAHRELQAARSRPSAIAAAGREIRYGTRHGQARFRWFMLPAEESGEGLVCWVENRTPELVYQPEVRAHPNGARRLSGLTVCVGDLGEAAARYRRWLGMPGRMTPGAVRFALGQDTIELLSADTLSRRWPGYTPPAVPGLVGLTVAVGDLAAACAQIETGLTIVENMHDRLSIVLPPPANAILTMHET